MLRVGLTGGIGSGKSSVSELLALHGAKIIDYDLLAREVVKPGRPALAAIVQRFGVDMIAADGTLNRPALGAIVFNDPESLRTLESITHPAIRALAVEREAAVARDSVVVHDNALLIEMGHHTSMDAVVVVDVPQSVQVERLMANRGMSEAEARARVGNQTSRESRTGVADFIIDNTGSVEELSGHVASLWASLIDLCG